MATLLVICGPMFAGKSTLLIERLARAASLGTATRAFKPARDTRYAADALATHTGRTHSAEPITHAREIIHVDAALVGIDEAHFFGNDLIDPVRTLLARDISVIVAGLERDHRGAPFDPMPTLLCEADEVIKLAGPCAVCGKPAVHSQRMTNDPARIVVGGAATYQPRCRACFTPGV